MDNQQFRRLVLNNPRPSDDAAKKSPASTVLGARKHSSISMTPRQVGRHSIQADFARQLTERNAKANPQKKFKSSAPKGTKLADGYIDRTRQREDEDADETAKRIKNLHEAMKLGQIDRETFDKLVQEITDGDIKSTHLVKGLDRKLLERVRRGEDVLEDKQMEGKNAEGEENGSDVEDEFEQLAEQETGSIVKEKVEKKGEKAVPRPVAGVKRSRNDILAEMKRQRQEAAEAAAAEHEKKYPSLGPGFRKVNANGETSRIEVEADGREVLIITGLDGKEKRKVRKQKIEDKSQLELRYDLDDPKKPINMNNLKEQEKEDSEDEDIFAGVGSNYNPLANLVDDDYGSSSEEEGETKAETKITEGPPNSKASLPISYGDDSDDEKRVAPTVQSHSTSKPPATKRDYFAATARSKVTREPSATSSADATVRAALAKVRNLDTNSALLQNLSTDDPDSAAAKEARLKKRAAELAASDRDMEDMDLGFGASRFDDAEDMEREGEKVKFSEWKGVGAEEDDYEDGDQGGRNGKKRKRGPKKKKGDKNSASDVLKVMERQKENKTLG